MRRRNCVIKPQFLSVEVMPQRLEVMLQHAEVMLLQGKSSAFSMKN